MGTGQSLRSSRIRAPPAAVMMVVAVMTCCHCTSPNELTRCGSADPSVSAPIMTPSAVPRPVRNQVDTSFSAGGYTAARKMPVSSRRGMAAARPSAKSRPRLAEGGADGAAGDQDAAGYGVGQAGGGGGDRADDEAELDGDGQQ